ncbi:MAG: hypothetical protein RL662_2180 [Bacteroidota bacterium]|jgi:murein DD-endopeptidase MepM/ murein hydrolase activator NlpD
MRNFLFLLFIVSSIVSANAESRKEIIVRIVQASNNFQDIQDVLPIIKKEADIYNFLPIGKPIFQEYRISSVYGNRYHPVDKIYKFHTGIDFSSDYANKIHSTAKGKVIFAGYKGGYGKCVIIEHNYGYSTLYAHLTLYYTKIGKNVSKGQVIGFVGSTGKSTGNHLHYEIRKNDKPINPIKWVNL